MSSRPATGRRRSSRAIPPRTTRTCTRSSVRTTPNSLTIIANYVPLEDPAGGPNFFPFDPSVRYEINIDNNGNGKANVRYEFRFKTHRKATNFAGIPTFLYNDGPITSLNDPNLLVWQTYSVWRNGNRIASNVPVAAGQHRAALHARLRGPRRRPRSGSCPTGPRLFAGPRDDAFFVDLGSIFDLAGLRPFNTLHALSLPTEAGVDGVGGFNTNSIAIRSRSGS